MVNAAGRGTAVRITALDSGNVLGWADFPFSPWSALRHQSKTAMLAAVQKPAVIVALELTIGTTWEIRERFGAVAQSGGN